MGFIFRHRSWETDLLRLSAVVMAIVLSVGLFRFNKTYQIKTGQLRRTADRRSVDHWFAFTGAMAFGAALHWDVPALRGFNFRGGMVLIPELAALTLALSVYTSAFIAEIIRAGDPCSALWST